jgi:hypothetical protein
MTTAIRHGDLQHPGAQPTAKRRIGSIVALSMAAGLIAAVVLVATAATRWYANRSTPRPTPRRAS